MIISDPDPSYQIISDLDPDPGWLKFWILTDPDPQHIIEGRSFLKRNI